MNLALDGYVSPSQDTQHAMIYFTYFPKFNLKSYNDLQFTKSVGSEFHSVIDLGKKENFKTFLETFGILYLKACND